MAFPGKEAFISKLSILGMETKGGRKTPGLAHGATRFIRMAVMKGLTLEIQGSMLACQRFAPILAAKRAYRLGGL
jgi:hypothetical protein